MLLIYFYMDLTEDNEWEIYGSRGCMEGSNAARSVDLAFVAASQTFSWSILTSDHHY